MKKIIPRCASRCLAISRRVVVVNVIHLCPLFTTLAQSVAKQPASQSQHHTQPVLARRSSDCDGPSLGCAPLWFCPRYWVCQWKKTSKLCFQKGHTVERWLKLDPCWSTTDDGRDSGRHAALYRRRRRHTKIHLARVRRTTREECAKKQKGEQSRFEKSKMNENSLS